jgi:putative sterol carrier protein
MSLKNKLYELFESIDVYSLEDLPKKSLKIGIKFGNNYITVVLDKSKVSVVENKLDKLDNEIITDEESLNQLLDRKASLLDLITQGKLYISGKLSNLLKLVEIFKAKSISLGFEESGLYNILKAVFEGICNKNEEILRQIRNFNATFQFSNGESTCCLIINEGKFTVKDGKCNGKPTASISAEKEVWNKIFSGEKSVGVVAMNGEAKIEGSLIQAFKLKTIIDKIF